MKIAALDIGGTEIKYTLYDEAVPFDPGQVKTVKTEAGRGGAAVMETACGLLSSLGRFDRVAVSTAGQVNPADGSILYATDNIPNYTGTPVKKIMEARFGVPAAVENDVNSAALGEAFYGAAREDDDFLCMTYGTGIGGAIVRGKKIWYGSGGAAGEFGHIITHAGGLPCTCGGRGCYEQYASTKALTRLVEKRCGSHLNGREIFGKLDEIPGMRGWVQEWMDEVLYGLVSLVYVFNPSCIVLGGGILNEPLIIGYLSERLPLMLMKSFRGAALKKAALGNSAGLLGAVHRALTDRIP